ncbi:hypothetical protein [Pelagicoccus sp. SDUM812005]|uniref:hypothetical protein n=1 Tax=Pelagicoccus sp. SDUM812005 TaxID=3041257 RepID=UPI00280F6B5E|nr:hypothetical protein [Pelagicoccus sp. SDUM812005]MDQ8182924.1 hypothetical protein [Pelagicoccus sp. SDUM812005]
MTPFKPASLFHITAWFALAFSAAHPIWAASEHPSIYGDDSTKAALQAKIENVDWAKGVYQRLKESVDPYVDRHLDDPEWIVSRLQMHWNTRYQKTFVNGSVWSHGEGQAPVPTVKFAGGRDWNSDYSTPALEDVQPYSDDERGMWLQNHTKPGHPWEWAPIDQTGHTIERINERIMELAETAAFLYWYTGEEKYATFAADIVWTYALGMYHRENPQTFEDHKSARIIGLATFEVIHERITRTLAVSYDYLHDYLVENGKDVRIIQDLFRRWADRIVAGGGSQGNWNINQARYIVYMGLALEDDSHYADGKGKQHYIRQFTTESTENQRALKDVVPETYDPANGVWPEAPGYAFSVTDTILGLAKIIHNGTGQDVLEDYPIIVPAATVAAQFLNPNGFMPGFGDTYHQAPYTASMEMLLERFRRLEQPEKELQVAQILKEQIELNGYDRSQIDTLHALTSYVDALPEGSPEESLRTRTFYADSINFLAQRNAQNEENGLMISLVGTRGGHMQTNGMAMELYGKGLILGPDAGRGPSYWTTSHGEYYMRYAAHNTVSVDGKSYYPSRRAENTFDIEAIEPAPGSHQPVSDAYSFSDTSFGDPATDSQQRRLLAIVKPSESTGYYVDIFRSRRKDGRDKKNEYIYHNLGQRLAVSDLSGNSLSFSPTEELSEAAGDDVSYNYFSDKRAAKWNRDFYAQFDVTMSKHRDVSMGLWMAGNKERTVFTANSPVARTLQRGSAPKELWDLPVPTLVVRQDGEAWSKPFVAIFEPFYTDKGSALLSIKSLSPSKAEGDFVGLEVTTKNDGTQYILNNTDAHARTDVAGIAFSGTYAVVSESDSGIQSLYLGQGTFLSKGGLSIDGKGKSVNASLEKSGDHYLYSANQPITVTITGRTLDLPPAHRAPLSIANPSKD